MSDPIFTWGDDVRVRSRGGAYASVCGVVEDADGCRYTVEFEDGSSTEVDEGDLASA